MKAIKFNLTAGLMTVLLFSMCNYLNVQPTDHIRVVLDRTDSIAMTYQISADDVLTYLRVDTITRYSYGARIVLTTLTDLKNNAECRVELPAESRSTSNHQQRKRAISNVRNEVSRCLREIQGKGAGTKQSLVFYSLFSQLEKLSNCKECDALRTLLFVSDLQENSQEFSVHNTDDLKLLQNNPEKIEALLDSAYHVDPQLLAGVRVIFAHRPSTQLDDEHFYMMSEFLKAYLTKKGIATETITSF